ncbi:biorientation of chromosomes in cell division protein 1-like 1 isoform X2 [Anopheles albimanus]|uniref:biorientation of chromosomes in cell division protein 1-like 1 isoform X2 n=1 Tax=Anopheles albimanus TaxID=7167 RepID=UPI001640E972|nr:biorientation of chromosomes in cell division protein 1-like 1 isoform X2 [Anopheles albimanus]
MVEDPHFIDMMVQELKSQGLFDQFRKECLADVDTKPAYQNLRQRVEGSVNKFLAEQEWSDNIRHKNQLREQLRKNIIDSGYLDTGVERIVDQVVNPKISTIFHPKVEELVYNYLGIEKPKSSVNGNEGARGESLLEDLEAVSPDSDKKSEGSLTPPQPAAETEHMEVDMEIDDDDDVEEEVDDSKEQDDFESPAFEPLEVRSPSKLKEEANDSNSSVISGLTSQESVESDKNEQTSVAEKSAEDTAIVAANDDQESKENAVTKDSDFSQEIGPTNDSQLSQVSSNSQLLPVTEQSASDDMERSEENERLDITEEAQMPTLFSSHSPSKKTDSSDSQTGDKTEGKKITFDFDKEGYEFVGTGRSSAIACAADESPDRSQRDQQEADESTSQRTTTEETKDMAPANFSTQEDTSSLSEHSLKICEDSISDNDTKESRSVEGRSSEQKRVPKVQKLSDASSCSLNDDAADVKPTAVSPSKDADHDKAEGEKIQATENHAEAEAKQQQNLEDHALEESTKDSSDKLKAKREDDHYEEHLKQRGNRRPSDKDSDGDGEEKSKPSGEPATSGSGETRTKPSTESVVVEKAEDTNKGQEKDIPVEASQGCTDRTLELELLRGTVTPTRECGRLDSSSSGIQSGDDSEKSPEMLKHAAKPESIVLPVQPVVIDQMLTNVDENKLEQLLNGEALTNDATLGSIQKEWQALKKAKKPKFASNFTEARRLMKVRKQIEREEQKRREKTLALAKKYINESKTYGGQMEDQGIELEFVCHDQRESPGPTISSPIPPSSDLTEQIAATGKTVEQTDLANLSDAELHFFPEPSEVFKTNEKMLQVLRSKTNGVTFPRSFKIQHFKTEIFTLTVSATSRKGVKRAATTPSPAVSGTKTKRVAATPAKSVANGLPPKLKLDADDTSLAVRKQRSIKNGHTQRLLSKSTPPSVGTDV